ncbi:MAG: hypothetical protein IPN61_06365 [Bacteroidetes bacterium]|nr:hypothetical protein [Bacteroidota bacterium]
MNDTLPDSLQISLLENIAFQYPSSGGEAVYWARAILHLDIEDNMISLRKRNPIVKAKRDSENYIQILPVKLSFMSTL